MAHSEGQSPPLEFPFLEPKRCEAKVFAPKLSLPEVEQAEEPGSGLGQTEPLKLERPFGRRVTQIRNANPARKPTLDGGFDQTRRDECHRYRHIDVTDAAFLPGGD